MFRHTFIVTWLNNIINVHSAVEKGLFWGNIRRKQGYSLLVGKQTRNWYWSSDTCNSNTSSECQNSNHFVICILYARCNTNKTVSSRCFKNTFWKPVASCFFLSDAMLAWWYMPSSCVLQSVRPSICRFLLGRLN